MNFISFSVQPHKNRYTAKHYANIGFWIAPQIDNLRKHHYLLSQIKM